MAMATAQARVISSCMGLLFLAVCVATLVKADESSYDTIELWFPLGGKVESSDYSADSGPVATISNFAHQSPNTDSNEVGQAVGIYVPVRENSRLLSAFLSFTYDLYLPGGYTGSISGQGITNSEGNGKVAITGGTGDFSGAYGYIFIEVIKPHVLLKSTIHVRVLGNIQRV